MSWSQAAGDFVRPLAALMRGLASLPFGLLPARYWQRVPWLPIETWAMQAGFATAVAGALAGATGFLAYYRGHREATSLLASLATPLVPPGQAAQGASLVALVAFTFASPLGLLAGYLVVSGMVRAMSAFVGQPFGDPVLSALDALVRRWRTRAREGALRRAREQLEGPEVVDRLVPGDACGLAATDLIVIAARRKADWSAGVIVVTPGAWFRLGEPFDVELPHGVRTAYPLTPMPAHEVLRRWVAYTLPPVQRAPSGLRRR